MSREEQIIIYTDGACSGNPGPGGYAALVITKKDGKVEEHPITGNESLTTNNRMELIAAIKGLESIDMQQSSIIVYTDSMYLRDGINSWIKKWKQNNWLTSKKEPVKNIDLWQKLDALCIKHTIEWKWVKAHNGDHYNEKVDNLARQAIIAELMNVG